MGEDSRRLCQFNLYVKHVVIKEPTNNKFPAKILFPSFFLLLPLLHRRPTDRPRATLGSAAKEAFPSSLSAEKMQIRMRRISCCFLSPCFLFYSSFPGLLSLLPRTSTVSPPAFLDGMDLLFLAWCGFPFFPCVTWRHYVKSQ